MIYLDNAATTQVAPEVLEAMLPYLVEEYGNANSLHALGRRARQAIETARRQVADLINCEPENIVFTSGGTEANNMAILGVVDYLKSIGKTHIVTSEIEHESVLSAVNSLIKCGFYVTCVKPHKTGMIDAQIIEEALTSNTGLISIMYVNNELGSVSHVEEIGKLCASKGIIFHTDCVQAVGNPLVTLNVDELRCDLLSLSAHKIHGTKGVGALYIRDSKYITPVIHGSATQEFGIRSGTENVAGIVGFGKACDICMNNSIDASMHYTQLYMSFTEALERAAKEQGIWDRVHFNPSNNVGKIVNLRFDGIDNESLILLLESKDVYISAGSACHNHTSSPSHVLKAIGLSDEEARSSVRVSFSDTNTVSEVELAAKVIVECAYFISLYEKEDYHNV